MLSLQGIDPRGWDLHRLLAAYEVQIRQGCKDDAEWKRTEANLTREPEGVRRERRRNPGAGPPPGRMTVEDAEAMLARMEAADASYR